MPRIVIVAGEASGDQLGEGLIRAIQARRPDVEFEGIAGAGMQAAGCASLYPMERLSVMGLLEVLGRLPELLLQRRRLRKYLLRNPPDLFIGIDAPDYNLPLERPLKAAGIPTVHYVSPSVWAWRPGRIKGIARAVSRMLTLFPFETDIYRQHEVDVRFVGHPMADRFPLLPEVGAARERLGLDPEGTYVALLPGSRRGEVSRLAQPLLETARLLAERRPELGFLLPAARPDLAELVEQAAERDVPGLALQILDGQGHDAMAAADAVVLASGTATLEAMLLKRPMAVVYRLNPITHWIMLRMMRIKRYSLPNLLAGRVLVPEFIQQDVVPTRIAASVLEFLDHPGQPALQQAYVDIHRQLRQSASDKAAEAVLELLH